MENGIEKEKVTNAVEPAIFDDGTGKKITEAEVIKAETIKAEPVKLEPVKIEAPKGPNGEITIKGGVLIEPEFMDTMRAVVSKDLSSKNLYWITRVSEVIFKESGRLDGINKNLINKYGTSDGKGMVDINLSPIEKQKIFYKERADILNIDIPLPITKKILLTNAEIDRMGGLSAKVLLMLSDIIEQEKPQGV